MSDLTSLIRDLEAAKEGSHELDDAIYTAIGGKDDPPQDALWRHNAYTLTAPHFTSSVDAALTLVPEAHSLAGLWEAVKVEDRPWWGCDIRRDEPRYAIFKVLGAKTDALALAVAALKARSASRDARPEKTAEAAAVDTPKTGAANV